MVRTTIALGSLVLVFTACSDDGAASSSGGTSGGGDGSGPFVTSRPPDTTVDPPAESSGTGDESGAMTTDAPAGSTGPAAESDGTSTGPQTDGTTAGTMGESTSDTGGVPVTPTTGDLVITEIMQNPGVLMDSEGEWFELHNPSATASYQLQGCTFEGGMTDAGFSIDAELIIGPGGYRVFATLFAGDQGFEADLQWDPGDFQLNNTADTVRLVCDANVVDEVGYDNGATFPDPTGASMSLDPGSFDAVANDDGSNWCEATTSYNGDLGTPGADNDPC